MAHRPLSRRAFLERALALGAGVTLPAGATLLDACSQGRFAAPRAGSAELGPIERELNLYNWSDYIAPEIIPAFEREFGVRVTYDTFESSEEMVAKLQAGADRQGLHVDAGHHNLLAHLTRAGHEPLRLKLGQHVSRHHV